MSDYIKIPEEKYQKAVGQLRLALCDVFNPFHCYGLQDLIPGAIDECVELAETFAMRVRGKDIPIELKTKYNVRRI